MRGLPAVGTQDPFLHHSRHQRPRRKLLESQLREHFQGSASWMVCDIAHDLIPRIHRAQPLSLPVRTQPRIVALPAFQVAELTCFLVLLFIDNTPDRTTFLASADDRVLLVLAFPSRSLSLPPAARGCMLP